MNACAIAWAELIGEYGPRQMPESMISEAHASFVSCSQVFWFSYVMGFSSCLVMWLVPESSSNAPRYSDKEDFLFFAPIVVQ